jgi:hypothetical protein
MKRWCISKFGEYTPGFIDPKIATYTDSWRGWSSDASAWGLYQFAVSDLQSVQADADIFVLPDASFDVAWSAIPQPIRTATRDAVLAAGLTFSAQIGWSLRDMLNSIVGQISPGIDVSIGDVQDI